MASEAFLQKYEDRLAEKAELGAGADEEGWKTVLPGMTTQSTSRRKNTSSRILHVEESEEERKLREFARKYREDGFYAVQAREKARRQLRELRAQMRAEDEVMRALKESKVLHPFSFKL